MKTMKKSIMCFVFILILFGWNDSPVYASISACSGSVNRSGVASGSSEEYSFTVTNDSPDTNVLWVRVTRPSSGFTVNSAQSGQWTGSASVPDSATYTGAGLTPGSQGSFVLNATAGDIASSANWSVEVSDDGGGASPTTCTGSFGTEITEAAVADPSISDIVVSDISDTQAKISWTTDVSTTATVDYGTTSEYGLSATGDTGTTHSVTITGLTANTTYHYNVKERALKGTLQNPEIIPLPRQNKARRRQLP